MKLLIICLVLFYSSVALSQDFWQPISPDTIVLSSGLVINQYGDIFGSRAYSIFRSIDEGQTWTENSMEELVYRMVINSIGYIFAEKFYKGVYRSTDNGVTWTLESTGIENANQTSIAINTNDDIYLGTLGWGGNKIYRSTNNGNTWDALPNTYGYSVRELAINYNGDIFAGRDDGLYRSTDNGENWNLIKSCSHQLIAFNTYNHIFLRSRLEGAVYYIYRSTDNGDNWTQLDPGNIDVSKINDIKINSNNYIFLATDGQGVYFSHNNGESWQQLNSGLLSNNTFTLAFDSEEYLYVGTDKGVFKSIQPSTILTTAEENYSEYDHDFKNYPNPFTDYTNIYFTIEESQNISLYLYDLSGRKIKCLIDNKYYNEGKHFMTMYADDLQPGIYILKTDKFIVKNKLIKIK